MADKGIELKEYDLCVIGGGINGAGVARDAAGRGLSVCLLEARDLASGTSSASSKLIHGGLRYLEFYDFKLVRESLMERERLLNIAPHIIWPMTFILPHDEHQRSHILIRIGLFLYDFLAPRKKLKRSRAINLDKSSLGGPLKTGYHKGFSYSDCWVEDSRLVALNAMDAHEKGAEIKTRSPCTGLKRDGDGWLVNYEEGGQPETLKAKMVVNAAGPWVRQFLEACDLAGPGVPQMNLVKGSHIIVNKAYDGDHAYILQQRDGRIVFVLPYQQDFTLIGTTEEKFEGDIYEARISPGEMDYLMKAFNQSFQQQLTNRDVLWTYSGVRPLFDDGEDNMRKASRDFKFHIHDTEAPMLSIFGGKLTTYRVVTEQAVDELLALQGRSAQSWTAQKPLPGGSMKDADFDGFLKQFTVRYSWLPAKLAYRYARTYGTRAHNIVSGASSLEELGAAYGDDMYEAEVRYLIREEWARELKDIIWRRTKRGLHIQDETRAALIEALPRLLEEELAGERGEE